MPALRTIGAAAAALGVVGGATALGQRADPVSPGHPAIQYATAETLDPVAVLNRRLAAGDLRLAFDPVFGYLPSVLDALGVPVSSQTLVYSKTSLQSDYITKAAPRALYFNDTVAVGWVRPAETLEVAAVDPEQGTIFYQIPQKPGEPQRFSRNQRCLECHLSSNTANVPGLLVMSMLPMSDDPREYAVGWGVDHRTPIEDRWGGWYVTGTAVPATHLGNVPVYDAKEPRARLPVAPKLASLAGTIDTAGYLSPYSDVVAQLVLNHQVQATNLIARLNWVARVAEHEKKAGSLLAAPGGAPKAGDPVEAAAVELVDYFLFVHEAPLPGRVQGSSGFSEAFEAAGPRDRRGRSLRQLDLGSRGGRLFRYPCSYLIYSPAFDALPGVAREAVYRRLWHVLSSQNRDPVYAALSPADRQAIVEILRETKPALP